MKHTKLFTAFTAAFALFALASCSDGIASKDDGAFVVTGSVSVKGAAPSARALNSQSARSATSSFSDSLTWTFCAYTSWAEGDFGWEGDETTALNPVSFGPDSFAFSFPEKRKYLVTAALKNGEAVFFYGTTFINTSETKAGSVISIEAAPRSSTEYDETAEGYGSVNLTVSAEAAVDAAKVSISFEPFTDVVGKRLEWYEANLNTGKCDRTVSFSSDGSKKSAVISIEEMFFGTYFPTLTFYDSNGKVLFRCTESLAVYTGCTTDTWYGSAPYITGNSFLLTSKLLESIATVVSFDYPVVLWNKTESDENDSSVSWTKGYNVFASISGGEKIGDGATLGGGTNISDFTIDPVTQKIYANISGEKIVVCDSYAGYSGTKTVAELTEEEIMNTDYLGEFSVYNDTVWVVKALEADVSLCRVSDYSFEAFSVEDDGGETVDLQGLNFIMTSDSNYVYFAYTSGENVVFKKYEIDEASKTLAQTASLAIAVTGTDSLELYSGDSDYVKTDYLKFDDLMLSSDGSALYALISDCAGYDGAQPKSRGGLLKIMNYTDSLVIAVMKDAKTFGWCPIDGNAAYYENANSLSNTYLYGRGKFIAKKPDELVIADDGGYVGPDGTGDSRNKNRVVTVNLKDASMSCVDVNVSFNCKVQGTGFNTNY